MTRQVALLLATVLSATSAVADVPQLMTYQGFLTDNSGNPVTNNAPGPPMSFELFLTPTGGSHVWSQFSPNVPVTNGEFSAILDFSTGWPNTTPLSFNTQYWLQITVNASVILPRIRLTSSPYALGLRLPFSETVGSSLRAFDLTNTGTGDAVHSTATNGAGVWGQSTTGNGVVGVSANTDAVAGYAQVANKSGVYGQNTYTPVCIPACLPSYGVTGIADAIQGRGVFGLSASGTGVYGSSTNGLGVMGVTNSPTGVGVQAQNTNSTAPALDIVSGSLRISGAGNNTATAAFTVTQTLANANHLIINNPMTNQDPSAILLITEVETPGNTNNAVVEAYYDGTGWEIVSDNPAEPNIPVGAKYNVLVIKTR